MYRLLTYAILAATLQELGGKARKFAECSNLSCVRAVASLSRDVTTVEWKPIVIFQKEASQFN